jgi:hypothetical protein
MLLIRDLEHTFGAARRDLARNPQEASRHPYLDLSIKGFVAKLS